MTLLELRKEKKLTQAQAAEIAGVTLASYKNHELGRSKTDSPLGKMIAERVSAYEPYGFHRGVLPMPLIESAIKDVFNGKAIDFAFLFGSYAKGLPTEDSDVDLLIAGSITGLDYFSLGGELERALHKKVDLLRLTDVLSNAELLSEIMATGVRIYSKVNEAETCGK